MANIEWNNNGGENENEVEEELSLQRKRGLQRSNTSSSSSSSNKDTQVEGGGLEFNESMIIEKIEIVRNAEMILQHEDTENSIILPISNPPPLLDESTSKIVASEIGKASMVEVKNQEIQELYLESVFQKSPSHGFYCPNCKSCIQKVYIQKIYIVPAKPQIRCSSCLSFLIPIGSWLGLVSDEGGELDDQDNIRQVQGSTQLKITSQSAASNKGKQSLQITEELILPGPEPHKVPNELDDKINERGQVTSKKKHFGSDWGVIGKGSEVPISTNSEIGPSKNSDWKVITATNETIRPTKPEIVTYHMTQPEQVEIPIEEVSTEATEQVEVGAQTTPLLGQQPVSVSTKKWEILKSIVYGGLNESLASLSVVTSAASADAATLNIVSLALANLIGGLFVLGHNLKELKEVKPKRDENEAEEQVDQYNELLGQRENFYLHAFVAILSFIVFGLVPPVVYGSTFRESDDKDLKLAAVAGASLLCITLLSIAKAYTKRPNNYLTYFQTVLYYVSTGAVASVLSYLAGDFVKKLLEKFGWLDSSSKLPLQIPGISIQQTKMD